MKLLPHPLIAVLLPAVIMLPVCAFVCDAAASEIEITAARLTYDEADKFMVAEGSATVVWEGKTLSADKMTFWVDEQIVLAEHAVTMVEGSSTVKGTAIRYDYRRGHAEITAPSGYTDPVYFRAEKAVRRGEGKYAIDRMVMTTCDLSSPHYTIRARRARISMNERLTVYHPVFYVRSMPVFYLPFFTQSLDKTGGSHIEIQPGYNSTDGVFVKVIYGIPMGSYAYGKLYLDLFSKRGVGTGAEYNYHVPGKLKGTLYGYHINEQNTATERWTLRGSYWQQLNPLWTGQAEAEFLSDTNFNNSYYLQDWQRTSQQIRSFAAATRQSSVSNIRIYAERVDLLNLYTGTYEPSRITLPNVSYTRFTFKNRLPFYTNFTASFQNQYTDANAANSLAGTYGYATLSGAADASITRDYRLSKKLTLKPRLGIMENWQDRTSWADTDAQLITRYYSDVNLRYRMLRWIDWDIRYNYKLRSEKNSLFIDYYADDYGEETNLFTFINAMYLNRLSVRNTTGYNFLKKRSVVVADPWEKLSPLVNEVTWVPSGTCTVYVREENTLRPLELKSIQTDTRIGNLESRYVNLGVFYQSYRPAELDINTGVGFWPTRAWRVDYTIRTTTLDYGSSLKVNDQELKLYRDLHCWEIKLSYRRRPGSDELYVQLDLKSSARMRQSNTLTTAPEFYPWR